MSVRSKALRFAIVISVIISVSGCAMNGSSTVESDAGLPGQESANEAVYGDSGEQPPAQQNSDEIPTGEISALEVTDSEQLLARTGDNVGIRLERGEGFSRFLLEAGETEPVFDVMMLDNPTRLVVDLLGQPGSTNQELAMPSDEFLDGVRVGGHHDRTRVVFDLKDLAAGSEALDHRIDTAEGTLEVTFLNRDQLAMRAADMPTSATVEILDEETTVASLPAPQEPQQADAEQPAEEQPEAVAVADPNLSLDSLRFVKTNDAGGQVQIGLSDKAAFELRRSAPSEYVLRIPGASVASRTTIPQIAPKGFPGMRSARAVQKDDEALVRMFVDPGTNLQAFPRGSEIVVESQPIAVAQNSEARAQLQLGDLPLEEEGETEELTIADENTARLNPTGIRSADGSKIYTGRLISLDLQDTDIDNALRIIAEVSNLNIIASDDVSGKVTLRLIDVPWDQALDVILKTNGLDQVTEGNVIRIAPVDKLRQEREALREAKIAAENLEDLTVQYIRVSYARVDELVEQVESVLSERGTVTVDQRTNQLIVKDIKKGHERCVDLTKRLDLRTPQVLLETQIIEGSRNVLRDLGFQWNFTYVQSPATGNATGMNFPNSVTVGGSTGPNDETLVNFPAAITDLAGSAITAVLDSADGSRSLSARLTALETEGKVKVISRPQVATVNNKQAEIRSVETVRVRLPDSGTSIATGSGASASGGGNTAFEEIDVGIELTVTPQASPDYYVLLDVNAKSSTFGSNQVDNIPSTLEREATSTILVKSGQTFALGGVYRIEDTDQVQGVPFLKDIPFLGVIFRRSLMDKSDEELIFFITPHIVEGSFDPSLM